MPVSHRFGVRNAARCPTARRKAAGRNPMVGFLFLHVGRCRGRRTKMQNLDWKGTLLSEIGKVPLEDTP